ncbi:MAG: phosphotransferase family protein [Proteobacteria bacterium]|nr:phosphotransferase family protein [Pseudomonadota bacterium]
MSAALDDFGGLLDWPQLQEWILAADLPGSGPVTSVERLQGGSQNNLFLLRRGPERMVLRRPPVHPRPNSDRTMLREARVLAALAGSEVPHPGFYAACADTQVIGVCFYVMEAIDGFTPMGALPDRYGSDPEWRRELGLAMVDGAAALAAVQPDAVGLGDFGKRENWIDRQVGRWRSQLEGYREMPGYDGPDLPEVDRVGEWIEAHRPGDFRLGVIHGDYQHANVMANRDQPALAAIVDWELSTLGDPRLDLAWLLTAWYEPGDPPGRGSYAQPEAGFPSRAELVERYAQRTGANLDEMSWWFTLACYKLGILLEGTHARACAGKAPKEIGDTLHRTAVWLFAKAAQLVDQASG